MQRSPATIEEQLIAKAIKEECPWDNLPKRLQSTLNSKDEWHRRIIDHCIKKRLLWSSCFARKVCKENEYYEAMMSYLRRNLSMFPYHLSEHVCRVMRLSPFRYYCDMIFEVMKNEQPYDSIPNFSAADALRLTGIGRNEFIDIMNKCRSKKIMWKINKNIAKELLPNQPVDFAIEPWWGVCLVNFTLEEFKKLSEEETATIDKICKEEANAFVLFDPEIVKGLYRRGLVYFDVPVYPDDRFKVSRLEGFISNREQSYEDPIEELLYAVFVVSNENSTVSELATTLQADLSQLQAAASFVCRLGWAEKVIDPASILRDSSIAGSPRSLLNDEEDGSQAILEADTSSNSSALSQGDALWTENSRPSYGYSRVAFVVDANITSYLMMGSVSPGLKSHAVTLYEAGKLGHDSIMDLCKDLGTLEGTKFEGELQEFANHAFSLRCVLECLTSGGVSSDEKDKIGSSLESDEVGASSATETSFLEESGDSSPGKFDPSSDGQGSLNVQIEESDSSEHVTVTDGSSPIISEGSDSVLMNSISDASPKGNEKPVSTESFDTGKGMSKNQRKYRVDILRCESLAALSPATLDRLFLRDYDIIVSMVPLPHSAILPGPKGPVHFGPPCHTSMTPWMKLLLYNSAGSGPLSVILMKGQCLRLLPAPLAGCEKALIWSWDGSTIGGLGGKFEGNLIKGNVLLHCVNSLLKHSAVLVQPLSKYDLDKNGKTITLDIPLPLKNSDGSPACIAEELGLSAEEGSELNEMLNDLAERIDLLTIGYIRVLRLFKEREPENAFQGDEHEWVPLSVEFGVPLFSPKLCKSISKRVVSSQLLQTEFLDDHRNAMQDMRKGLRTLCAEYQATGGTAKLLYQKELAKSPSRQLMNYASGRWNPLVDPSSPISGASSERQRIKLANRQRCGTEVLSFDGSILRSYALSPVYESGNRLDEESSALMPSKPESDDADSREVVLPAVNLLFDGSELRPFDIGACLQARQPVSLIAEASSASAASAVR